MILDEKSAGSTGGEGGGLMKTKVMIEVDSGAAKDWIKTHTDTKIEDTPLWVLIGLGLMVLEDDKE